MKINKNYKILVVDDEVEYQDFFHLILSEVGYDVFTSSSGNHALDMLEKMTFDLVITDLKMPGINGMELVEKIKGKEENIDILIVTAFGSIESAVEAMKKGAIGYFVKSRDAPESLLADVEKLFQIKRLVYDNEILKQKESSCELFLETKSPKFKDFLDIAKQASNSNISILLLGESGVGKEVVANYIHSHSERKSEKIVPVNCQVFSEGTIESELFGHEKGSFTGAVSRRIGKFEEANYGTLFLDEVGDLPLAIQGKLLRALETRTVERMGSNVAIKLDIRLICATNKVISNLVSTGEFREDLLYRINALTLTVPSLRERKEDLKSLIYFFLSRFEREQKKTIKHIDESLMDILLEYDYPGNIRELKNILERLVVFSKNGVLAEKLGSMIITDNIKISKYTNEEILPLKIARGKFEKEYIENIIFDCEGSVSKAACVLKISIRQMWNKISEYRITIEK